MTEDRLKMLGEVYNFGYKFTNLFFEKHFSIFCSMWMYVVQEFVVILHNSLSQRPKKNLIYPNIEFIKPLNARKLFAHEKEPIKIYSIEQNWFLVARKCIATLSILNKDYYSFIFSIKLSICHVSGASKRYTSSNLDFLLWKLCILCLLNANNTFFCTISNKNYNFK